jgi:SagB-type dehydrogenase family enzyme
MKNPSVKSTEDPVPVFDYPVIQTIKLPNSQIALPVRFDKVIMSRKTQRKFDSPTIEQLGSILRYTAKVKNTWLQNNGYILTQRGVPSAGARHPIDIVVWHSSILDSRSFYYYNPFDHSLNQLKNNNDDISAFLKHINEIVKIKEAAIFWFVMHVKRTSAKYDNAESLVWRDAGALINAIQLVCTAMELNCCPIGSLGEPFISGMFDGQDGIFGAGGLLIG